MGMTAYEFTRFDVDFTAKVKAQAYDANVIALQIEYAHKEDSPREHEEYEDAKHTFIELTMSCDREEALGWMRFWMVNALAYGIATKERDWQYKYLAAYDLQKSIMKGGF